MKLLSIGDSGCDCYLDDCVLYPGGQALNVAVNALRSGAEKAAYLGIFGNDKLAAFLRRCARKEGVELERCRKAYAPTAQWGVRLVEGDRHFVGGPDDVVDVLFGLRLSAADLAYAGGFDVVHTTNEAGLDNELAKLHEVATVSYDFSVYHDGGQEWLARICPHVDIAFFSGEKRDGTPLTEEELRSLISSVHALGTGMVVVTLGRRGSVCSADGMLSRQGIVPVEMKDSMGAGDSYAAAFLVRYFDTRDVAAAMAFASERAAQTVMLDGAFGYGRAFDASAWPEG